MQLEVLYEDNHLLAVNKPAGLATMGASAGAPSLWEAAKAHLKQRYQKPGNVYLGVVMRLDAVASGVVLFARTSKAAARLSEQFRTRAVTKEYWAFVEGTPAAKRECVDWLVKNEQRQRIELARAGQSGAQEARLNYQLREQLPRGAWLEIELLTGRKHQIRVQLASRGHPILGDRKYGARSQFAAGIALHARRLVVSHPVQKETIELIAPLPPTWRGLGTSDQ